MDLNKVYIFRMTHVDNIEHIIENGLTHKNSLKSNPDYTPIGDSSLINTRDNLIIPNGSKLGEYIPFYFGFRTPMLYVVQNGYNGVKPTSPNNIIYCVSSVQKILDNNLNFFFTDGHATDNFSSFYSRTEIDNIEQLVDFEATNAKFWKKQDDLDFKRRKEADFLIKEDLPSNLIIGYIVNIEESKNKLIEIGVPEKLVVVKPNYFF